ncbi:MAG: hypothetical protein CM15mV36_0360 [Caudoviricetes sp.]|nr:MAG: hypothetical protein CM15mV36_0360 [Caudoviricetes sp.]
MSTDVPAPVTWIEPILNAPSVPVNTSEELLALVKSANSEEDLSKPKKPSLAEPS